MPSSVASSLEVALCALLDDPQFIEDVEGNSASHPAQAGRVMELFAQPHLPTADVAYATGSLAGALCRGGANVAAPLLNDGRDHSDVLHWSDGLGRTWVIRVVGQVS